MKNPSVGVDGARPSTLSLIQDRRTTRPHAALEALASVPAVLMTLVGKPSSTIATDAVDALVALVFSSDTQKQKPSAQYRTAMGAVVADLLNAAAHDPYWPCKRRMDSNAFSGSAVGYHSTVRVLDDLCRHSFVQREKGREGLGGQQGYVTRILPTIAFVEFMEARGINPAARLLHFVHGEPPLPRCPVRLKSSSRKANVWKKIKGRSLPVSINNSKVASIAAPILRLNEYYRLHSITLDTSDVHEDDEKGLPSRSPVLFRGFNCGDMSPYHWDKGGRLYPYDGHYQQLHKDSRKHLYMDGEPTVEVDIHACYLTIVYALLGRPLHAADDLYTFSGANRDAVKMFVNTTLSKGEPIKAWLPDHRKRYDKKSLKRLQQENPIKDVTRQTLAAIPIIKEANSSRIDWSTLIYYESEVMVATLQKLAFEYNVFALPMHDGVIVGQNDKEQAKDALTVCFNQVLGLNPIVRIK